ncbi:MAG: hypothetical protein V7744_21170 [Pseudomonadales bacterium]
MPTSAPTVEETYKLAQQLLTQQKSKKVVNLAAMLLKHDGWNMTYQALYMDALIQLAQRDGTSLNRRLELLEGALRFGVHLDKVETLYFDTLDKLLARKNRLPAPGKLVIGLGPGRNGSTSLATLLSTIDGSFITHESYPMIFADPTPAQLAFHIKKFHRLLPYCTWVGDVSHWWIYATDKLRREFPGVKFITLNRKPGQIIDSFQRVKGLGKGSNNHWTPSSEDYWSKSFWDFSYPDYPLPNFVGTKEQKRANQIASYVAEYYYRAHNIRGDNLMLHLDTLDSKGRLSLQVYLGILIKEQEVWKNKGGIQDSFA